jgi:hypothetical protein
MHEMIKQGEVARLFPVLAETSREKRLTSVLLAALPVLPALAKDLLAGIAPTIRKTTEIEAYTEVVFKKGGLNADRPDGLLILKTRSRTWTAIIEAKAGKAELQAPQIEKYLDLAKINKIDAVITISNQFVARPEHSPADIPEKSRRGVGLFHLSWPQVQTSCALLGLEEFDRDPARAYILENLAAMLSHTKAGVERVTNMGNSWKEVVQAIADQNILKQDDPFVLDAIGSWHQKIRDMSLSMSERLSIRVSERMERRHQSDPASRLYEHGMALSQYSTLQAALDIPDYVSPLEIQVDIARKSIFCSVRMKAPVELTCGPLRTAWLMDLISSDDSRLQLRAHFPGRKPFRQKSFISLREDLLEFFAHDNTPPSTFEVILVEELGRRFYGPMTFIQDLDRLVAEFHDLAGQHLRHSQRPQSDIFISVTPEKQALSSRECKLLWLGGLDGILTHADHAPVNMMRKLDCIIDIFDDIDNFEHPSHIHGLVKDGADPVSIRYEMSKARTGIEAWAGQLDLIDRDVEFHFLGYCLAVSGRLAMMDEEYVDLIERSSHDSIIKSNHLKGLSQSAEAAQRMPVEFSNEVFNALHNLTN